MIRDYVERLVGEQFVAKQAEAWLDIRDMMDDSAAMPVVLTETGGSVNGPASSLKCTESIRAVLPRMLASYGVRTMLDAPCGDWNWLSTVEMPGVILYIGWDVDPVQIERDQAAYGNTSRCFAVQNILTAERIPDVDLILCRDFLPHLPTDRISAVLDVFKASRSRYLLTSNYPDASNEFDYHPEHFAWLGYMERPVNLQAHPFGLHKINAIPEDVTPGGVNSRPHELGLFELHP